MYGAHLRASRTNSTEGILSSSVGEFPFLILPSISEKCLTLSIPEEFVGEFSIELTGVRGCLIDPVRHRFQTVVLSPMHYLHFERQEYSVEEPKEDELVVSAFFASCLSYNERNWKLWRCGARSLGRTSTRFEWMPISNCLRTFQEILFVRVARGDTTARRTKIDFRIITVAGTARETQDFNPIDKGKFKVFRSVELKCL